MDQPTNHDLGSKPNPIKSLFTSTLSGQPSCIAFVPQRHDLFVIGTYQLNENNEVGNTEDHEATQSQSRSGTVQLFRLESNGQVTLLQTHDLASASSQDTYQGRSAGAILDLRFCSLQQYQDHFAACTSTGLILLFQVEDTGSSPRLELARSYALFENDTLLTSLSWDPDPALPDEADLAATLSDGRVIVTRINLQKDTKAKAETLHTFTHHTESAWTAQWCPSTTTGQKRLATGGDDRAIHIVTLSNNKSQTHQTPDPDETHPQDTDTDTDTDQALHTIDKYTQQSHPTAQHTFDTRTHEAGVTSIIPLPIQSNSNPILATGSYDNTIRILESRSDMQQWHTLAEADLEGGVWKLEVLAERTSAASVNVNVSVGSSSNSNQDAITRYLILASCMHAGVRVLEVRRRWNARNLLDGQDGQDRQDEWEEREERDQWGIDVVASFSEHGSMCYASGAASLHRGGGQDEDGNGSEKRRTWRVVSTSFYDRMLCVWDFEW